MEKPVSFLNNKNHRLFGILHIPENESGMEHRIGINLLNPGLKNRVAPNRLNIKIARKLCNMGFYVLRFDPYGIGDSEGNFMGANEPLIDLWNMIKKGAFVDDTIVSNNFLVSEIGQKEVVLIGQCGAGVTAGLAGALDHRVKKMILIDTPFKISSSDIKIAQVVIDSYDGKQLLKEQLSGFWKFNWLAKLYANGISIKWLREKGTVIKKIFDIMSIVKQKNVISEKLNLNLSNALIEFINNENSIYFIFAENDFSLREFNSEFRYNFLEKQQRLIKRYSFHVIANANHIYTEKKWQNELLHYISACLKPQVFPE